MQKRNITNNRKKNLGKVTSKERDTIRELYERRNALMELLKALSNFEKKEADYLYEKLIKDLSQVNAKYHDWWQQVSQKYHWENTEGMHWEVEFDTCTVFLNNESSV
jgi:CXXX repeat modification system protein